MDDKAKRSSRAALKHALAALRDGSGHEVWGPGVVGLKVYEKNEYEAAHVFDDCAQVLFKNGIGMKLADRPRFIAGMQKLAPVLLDILLDE